LKTTKEKMAVSPGLSFIVPGNVAILKPPQFRHEVVTGTFEVLERAVLPPDLAIVEVRR
jgi:hypothetical protein